MKKGFITKRFILSITLILLISFLFGCTGSDTEPASTTPKQQTVAETEKEDIDKVEKEESRDSEKRITHITSGIIKADSLIAVRFMNEQVKDEDLNQPIRNLEVFNFDPQIEGQHYWEDKRTLVFKPNKPLYDVKQYVGTLNLKALFPEKENVTPEKKTFRFETIGQGVRKLDGHFKMARGEDESQFLFSGQLELTEKADIEQVKKALSFKEGQRQVSLEFATQDNLTFDFITAEQLTRTEEDKEFTLLLEKEPINIEENYEKNYQLTSINKLKVTRVEEVKSGSSSNIRIVFSDKLNPHKTYSGYVNLKPESDYDVEVDGNSLILDGNFQPGQKYRVQLLSGITSRWGKELTTSEDYDLEIDISDIKPRVEFFNSGVLLTDVKDNAIAFRTMNVERVHIEVKKVYEDNIIEFIDDKSFDADKDDYYDYNRYRFKRVGEVIESRILELGTEKNTWIQSEIDLSKVIESDKSNLYIVQLEFDEDDALYFPDHWSNHRIREHVWDYGRQVKHLIRSNIGITAKKTSDQTHVFVTDIMEAEPVTNAAVILKNDDNDILEKKYTDKKGMVQLERKGEYIEVRKGYEFGLMKFSESRLGTSLFDVGGVDTSSGIKAFIYTDRGVYRPGDTVNLSLIARNEDDTFPLNHPVTLKVYNPKNKLVVEETNKKSKDGFYSFDFITEDTALTGNWKAELVIGGRTFRKKIKIEELVPYRIRVHVNPEKEKLSLKDEEIKFTVSSKYLFGTPAGGLNSKTEVMVEPYEVSFNKFKNFTFYNDSYDFRPIDSYQFEEELDKEGKTTISWNMPEIDKVPSALRARIETKVIEKGGRPVPQTEYIPIEVFDRYVGIKEFEKGSFEMGNKANFDIILVDEGGEFVPDKKLEYRIYRMRRYWWWEYDNDDISFKRHYKTDSETELIDEGTLTSQDGIATLEYNIDDYGGYLIEVEDVEGGHSSGYFFRSYWWGDDQATSSADTLNIKGDKAKYYPGDTARILVKTPENGKALVTVEKGNEILLQKWQDITSTNTEIEIPVGEDYLPNAYVSVAVFQPYKDKDNDMPVRMYGIMPIKVEKKDTRLKFEIDTPGSIEPGQQFDINVKANKKAQFTIAVVDEGLLNITRYNTPDPWSHFFQKERLLTRTYDVYSDIIGLNWGSMHNVFSIGGDARFDMAYREKQAKSKSMKTKRFKPVAFFQGPIETNEEGEAKVSFTMPEYIGSVKVMVVGAAGEAYGKADKDIPVKSPLMVMPTLPRVLGPDDEIRVPVTVFGMENDIGQVDIKVELEGPLEVMGEANKTLTFTKKSNKDTFFRLRAKPTVGKTKVKITASSKDYSATKEVDLAIRAYNPYTYISKEKIVKEGETISFEIPDKGIDNSTAAQISLATHKSLNLNHRLKWLIRYPYGCIEQTTSSVFPQLYMADIFTLSNERLEEIDENINAAIERLRKFQLSNGGFSYWPNGNKANLWGTNYAGHFLIEAQQKGYYVPQEMMNNWLDFQIDEARDNSDYLLTRTYRLYLLALADNHQLSSMNYLRESKLDDMRDTTKYYLAAAYQIGGYEKIAKEILDGLDTEVEDYREFGGTYGSALRDKAIMLQVQTLFENYEEALALYNEIGEEVSSDEWMSTQTSAYSLLALGKYLTAVSDLDQNLTGKVILANQEEVEFEFEKTVYTVPVDGSLGKEVKVVNNNDRPIYASMEWEGIPLRDGIETSSNNLNLEVEWLNEEGDLIDPTELKQGTTFWGHFRVSKDVNRHLEELALVQILPSGWEIENIRLLGGQLPYWMEDNFRLNKEDYLDIRDDRIMWFFDMSRYRDHYDFVVKLNAVTVGDFYLPPTMVEAMYNNKYKATQAGKRVKVIKP